MSVVDIWNLALTHLGNKAGLSSASPPYTSREAELCGVYWPHARRFALAEVKPHWARKRKRLSLVDLGDNQPPEWQFTYQQPENSVSFVGVYAPEAIHDEAAKSATLEIAGDEDEPVVYTNVEEAWGRYIKDVESVTQYSAHYLLGVSWVLASFVAGAHIKGTEGADTAKAYMQTAMAWLGKAKSEQANETDRADVYRDRVPSQLAARGYAGSYPVADAKVSYDED